MKNSWQEKFSHSSNLSIQQMHVAFVSSANMRAGDMWISDGIIRRGIILPCGSGCMHARFVLLALNAEGWMAPEVKYVQFPKKLKAE